ncbi:MAG: hypothetical protein IPG71_13630 [bacterium]|nr:hypothetical protein [bacterium]
MIRNALFALVLCSGVFAFPMEFNHQGFLADTSGAPSNGTHLMAFRLYDGPGPLDSLLWSETHASVTVTAGLYAVTLGASTSITNSIIERPALWLGVPVGGDGEMQPRIRVVAVPYAICAWKADTVTTENVKDLIQLWATVADADLDGFAKAELSGDDCDDWNPFVHPGAVEVCDNIDNNCNGLVDEEFNKTWWRDIDNDGWGDPELPTLYSCVQPSGYALLAGDCDENDAAINPGVADSICNGIDNNCNGLIDDWPNPVGCTVYYYDEDFDGFGDILEISQCLCTPDVYYSAVVAGDCNDSNPSVFPGANEVCNGMDDNCDGITDPPGSTGGTNHYRDVDDDGYGDDYSAPAVYCLGYAPPGWITMSGDCDDTNPNNYSGAPEVCDGQDNDCNGMVDQPL